MAVAIIGTLVALLLPAVQAAREAARRLQCANHLKQIGLAVHGYHGATGNFPPGNVLTKAGYCPGVGGEVELDSGANWLLAILPYLEQNTLAAGYDYDAYNEGEVNRWARETFVPVYSCPADLEPDTPAVPATGPASAGLLNLPYMPGSYRAVSGRSEGWRFLDSANLTSYPTPWRGAIHAVGVYGFTVEQMRDVRDGLSQTLLAGESTTRTSPEWRTFWAYSHAHYSLSAVTPQSRVLLGDFDRCKALDGTGRDEPCRRGWGGNHPDGLNFVCCDGAVHFVGAGVDMELLARLATIDGEETVQTPW
ncbi:MAG: DUF1559 domain-containing protein [Pirellulaceae bacterium]|nr:DUF1559 domain-containing protein [Pirellulaceae bacterium]